MHGSATASAVWKTETSPTVYDRHRAAGDGRLPAHADNQADARRLLRISAVAQGFAEAARQQTETIISTYASIVAESTDTELPDSLKAQIAQCYEETFAWERFEPGIVAIFADNLSQEELTLLIDFFSDRSVPRR